MGRSQGLGLREGREFVPHLLPRRLPERLLVRGRPRTHEGAAERPRRDQHRAHHVLQGRAKGRLQDVYPAPIAAHSAVRADARWLRVLLVASRVRDLSLAP